MSKKILYISCHEILEYDEVKLFTELGHQVYSLGAYTHPGGNEHRKRPALDLPYDPHFIELSLQYSKEELHPEMLENIDIVIIMHQTKVVTGNWDLFRDFIAKGGRVIWRSIGQSIPRHEKELSQPRSEGLEIVRYSVTEETIEEYLGADAVIYFYKDPEEYKDYVGDVPRVVNFTQSMRDRGPFCGYKDFLQATRGLKRVVYGPGNENLGDISGGLLSNEEQLQAYRENRAYFYHGTYPASYTLTFIEALMTGIPVVCVGPERGNSQTMFPFLKCYEPPLIIEDGVNGFISDDMNYLNQKLKELINNPKLARSIGDKGRQTAIDYFGKAKIKALWKEYLDK